MVPWKNKIGKFKNLTLDILKKRLKIQERIFLLSIWLSRELWHCSHCTVGQERKLEKNILIKGKDDKIIVYIIHTV